MGYTLSAAEKRRLGLVASRGATGPRTRRAKPEAAVSVSIFEPGHVLCDFRVPGNPVPKARARWSPTGTFTPEKTQLAEHKIAQYLFVSQPGLRPYTGAVSVTANFYVTGGRISDCDNLLKTILDAICNGLVLSNDRWVDEIIAHRYWVKDDPHTHIVVSTLSEGN